MTKEKAKVTETQKGIIGEYLISTYLILKSHGRLSPAFTWADDSGIDLIVHDKETNASIPVQVKSRFKSTRNYIRFEVRKATYSKEGAAFLIAVYFDDIVSPKIGIKRCWLIPMTELETLDLRKKKKFMINPNWKSDSDDKFKSYRCNDMEDLTGRLIKFFDERISK